MEAHDIADAKRGIVADGKLNNAFKLTALANHAHMHAAQVKISLGSLGGFPAFRTLQSLLEARTDSFGLAVGQATPFGQAVSHLGVKFATGRSRMVFPIAIGIFLTLEFANLKQPIVQALGISASSKMATARVQPAEAPRILCGKQLMKKPVGGSASRLCSFSMWQ